MAPRNPSYDFGYLQALRDIRLHLHTARQDRDTTAEGKEELGVHIEFLERLIASKAKRAEAGSTSDSGN